MAQPRTADLPCISYSVPNAAKVVDVPETKLWQAIKDKQLRSFKVGRSRRVTAPPEATVTNATSPCSSLIELSARAGIAESIRLALAVTGRETFEVLLYQDSELATVERQAGANRYFRFRCGPMLCCLLRQRDSDGAARISGQRLRARVQPIEQSGAARKASGRFHGTTGAESFDFVAVEPQPDAVVENAQFHCDGSGQ